MVPSPKFSAFVYPAVAIFYSFVAVGTAEGGGDVRCRVWAGGVGITKHMKQILLVKNAK